MLSSEAEKLGIVICARLCLPYHQNLFQPVLGCDEHGGRFRVNIGGFKLDPLSDEARLYGAECEMPKIGGCRPDSPFHAGPTPMVMIIMISQIFLPLQQFSLLTKILWCALIDVTNELLDRFGRGISVASQQPGIGYFTTKVLTKLILKK
jgi:hypothetical protein